MMYNNHKKSGCGFEELLVSYLYDETTAADKAILTRHLENCAGCADELAAFADVKFSVGDWKSNEFALLETPVIEIPYESTKMERPRAGVKNSWIDALHALFSLSPARSLATASLALLAVCAGIALFALNSSSDDQFAEKTNKSATTPSNAPTAEKTPDSSKSVATVNPVRESEVKPAVVPGNPPSETVAAPDVKNSKKPLNKTNARRETPKAGTQIAPINVDSNRSLKNNQQVAPKIIEDEEEDDTLRLAELFEEIETVE